MRAITIEAKSLGSARGIYSALSEFHPELTGSDEEGYRVSVELRGANRQALIVLAVLEGYVESRDAGPLRIRLGGRH